MLSLASCRGNLAPQCRCSDASLGLSRPGFPAGFAADASSDYNLLPYITFDQKSRILNKGMGTLDMIQS